ncbi:MAG: aryl-sulfate sulfotransferase [Lachnospiraceae bacterium]|nr:aryl-sulfate sulfotransferase [Lachnospiraceae bacterium]
MKGKIRVIIITLVVLLAGTGVFLWKMNDISKKLEAKAEEKLKEERDLIEDQKRKAIDKVKEVDIIPLYLSGDRKNVEMTKFSSVSEIYTTKKSDEVTETLAAIKRNRNCTPKDPLWAYDPYGTNRNSMYVYFRTSGNCYLRYTISVKDDGIGDFTRTAYTGGPSVTKEHEYQITGLVAGEKNYIVMNLYNSDDQLSETRIFSVDVPKSKSGAENRLSTKKGTSKKTISNGLFTVFGKRNAILFYDNSGVLRGEIPLEDNTGRNMEQIYDTLTYTAGKSLIVQVDFLGKVVKTHKLKGYTQSGDFIYDGSGSLYVIATAKKKKAAPKSKVIQVTLENSAIDEMVDMDTVLKSVYEKARKKAHKKNVDWIGIDSIQLVGSNALLISSKKLSSIIKVSGIGSLVPKLNYIIADKKLYKGYDKKLRKKVLKKLEDESAAAEATEEPRNILKKPVKQDPFPSFFGPEMISYKKKGAEGQYTLRMFAAKAGDTEKGDGNSYYLTYVVDEVAGTYDLKKKYKVAQTKKDGNYISNGDQYIYCCSDGNFFTESDTTGRVLKDFMMSDRPYRVYKNDFKQFWFR